MMVHQRKLTLTALILLITAFVFSGCSGSSGSGGKAGALISPTNGQLEIPVAEVSDGMAHHYQVKASDGNVVTFFVLKSADGILRAAIDACESVIAQVSAITRKVTIWFARTAARNSLPTRSTSSRAAATRLL
jgi:hypothetical protein